MNDTYTTIKDVIDSLIGVFGDYRDEYDIDAIAHEITEYDTEAQGFRHLPQYDAGSDEYDAEAFNEILARHAI